MRPETIVLSCLLLTLCGCGAASASSVDAQALALACGGCHGSNHQAPGIVPRLIGMEPSRFIGAMRGFQSGAMPAVIMNRIAPSLSEEEIAALAAYFNNGARR